MRIWRRYLLFRLFQSFLFILLAIFALFVFVDLATRSGKVFGKQALPGYETVFYYGYQFSSYLHLFFPLSFLFASMRILLDANTHHELTALQMGGLSRKRLLSPFILLASLLFALLLANYQWVAPKALASAYDYTKIYARHKKRSLREHLQTFSLPEGSEIVFQSFDSETKELFDVFWLQDSSTLWHMKFLAIAPSRGRFVERFEWEDKQWKNRGRFAFLDFPTLLIDEAKALQPFIPYERRPLLDLALQASISSAERSKLLSHLFYKILTSASVFLILFLLAPVCFTFSRGRSAFAILAISLGSFLAAMMLLDGLLVLGENQVLSVRAAFGLPLALLLAIPIRSLRKL